jgi:hypothetical protein
MNKKENMYKLLALIGTITMGIGSFMSCLGSDSLIVNLGTLLLVFSIILMSYSFYNWRP